MAYPTLALLLLHGTALIMSPLQTAAFASGFQFPNQPGLQTFPAYQQFAVMQSIPRGDRRLLQPFADFRKRQWTSGLRASQLHEQQQAESSHSDETYTYLDESSIRKSEHDDSDSTTVQTAPESSDEELAITGTIGKKKTGILDLGLPPESILLLNLVAIIWGSQHAVIKTCIQDLDPASFSLVRFFLGSLFATPAWIISSASAEPETNVVKPNGAILNNTWRWGIELGLWMFLGYAFQAIGLEVR